MASKPTILSRLSDLSTIAMGLMMCSTAIYMYAMLPKAEPERKPEEKKEKIDIPHKEDHQEPPTQVQAPVEIALSNPTQTESCRFIQSQINGLNQQIDELRNPIYGDPTAAERTAITELNGQLNNYLNQFKGCTRLR